jgi:hypothetical protein
MFHPPSILQQRSLLILSFKVIITNQAISIMPFNPLSCNVPKGTLLLLCYSVYILPDDFTCHSEAKKMFCVPHYKANLTKIKIPKFVYSSEIGQSQNKAVANAAKIASGNMALKKQSGRHWGIFAALGACLYREVPTSWDSPRWNGLFM